MANPKPTMKSIAEDLQVSRSTVSFVLAGEAERRRINPETANRILERARELGFRPNYFAQALNTRKTGAIGLVFPDVHEAFMAEMLRGIDEIFARHDVTMMLCSSRMDRALEMRNIESLLYRGIDGLIIVPCADFTARPSPVPPLAERLAAEVPVVCADRIPQGWTGHSVVQDDRAGARRAVAQLVGSGARRIGCISFDLDASSSNERIAGYYDALAQHGLSVDARWQIRLDRIDPQADDLSGALRALLGLPETERPDAWFVTTTGLSYRTRELLAAFRPDDTLPPIARFGADPPFFLSGMVSVVQPHHEIGRRAAELLFEAIADPKLAPSHVVLPSLLA